MTELPTITPKQDTEDRVETVPPYKVLLHNDDVTTFDFVIWLLITVFQKSADEAVNLTWTIHNTDLAIVCVTHKERAELYVEQVHSLARPRGFPLVASMEPA